MTDHGVSTWAIVTTYQPDSGFKSLVHTLRKSGIGVVVVDNTDPPAALVAEVSAREDGVVAILFGTNVGLARALNRGIAEAAAQGAEIVMLWDQDSRPDVPFVQNLLSAFREERTHGPLLLGGAHQTPGSGGEPAAGQAARVAVDHLITSSLVGRIEDFEAVGPFREDFWVDMVDVDFSYRARLRGVRLVRADDLTFVHGLGRPGSARKVPGSRTRHTSGHAVWRQYWIARNGAILGREYRKSDPDLVRRLFIARLDWLGRVLLAGPHRLAVLRAWLAGVRDARSGAMSTRYSRAFARPSQAGGAG